MMTSLGKVLSSESCSCQNMWWSQMASREENVIHLSSWQVIYLCEIVWQIKVYPKNQETYFKDWTPPLHSLPAVSFFLPFFLALYVTLDNSAVLECEVSTSDPSRQPNTLLFHCGEPIQSCIIICTFQNIFLLFWPKTPKVQSLALLFLWSGTACKASV